jgi:hypothetical protein
MIKWIVIAVLSGILGGLALASTTGDGMLWSKIAAANANYDNDRLVFILDKETGTRCYAITNNRVNASGYAIACVKPGGAQ